MTTSVRGRLLQGFAAQGFGQIIGVAVQIFSLPIFLLHWGTHLYGEWILLSTIPAYLSFSNMGFGYAAGTEMTMEVARGNKERAIEVYQSTWVLLTSISTCLALLVTGLVFVLPISSWLNLRLISPEQVRVIVILLTLQLAMAEQRGLLSSFYQSDGRYARGVLVQNLLRVLEFAVTAVIVWRGGDPIALALGLLVAMIVGNTIIRLDVRRLSPWMVWGWKRANVQTLKHISGPAMGSMGIPIGHALSLQGLVMVVGIVISPAAVVLFTTTRTLTRFIWQVLNSIASATMVEYSVAFGKGDQELARKIHRRACQSALWLSILFSSMLFLSGSAIYTAWTKGKVAYNPILFQILLVVAICDSLWSTSYVVPMSVNKHQKMAGVYVTVTALSLGLSWVFTQFMGVYGPAVALVLMATAMNLYVLNLSLSLLNDNMAGFARAVLRLPVAELVGLIRKVAPSRKSTDLSL